MRTACKAGTINKRKKKTQARHSKASRESKQPGTREKEGERERD